MYTFYVTRFHITRELELRVFLTLKTPIKTYLNSGRFFCFGLISGFGLVFCTFQMPWFGLIRFLGVLDKEGLENGFLDGKHHGLHFPGHHRG